MMTQSAMHMINISATTSVYHITILARLQHKIMEVISSNNVAKRDHYGLPELLADIRTFCHQIWGNTNVSDSGPRNPVKKDFNNFWSCFERFEGYPCKASSCEGKIENL